MQKPAKSSWFSLVLSAGLLAALAFGHPPELRSPALQEPAPASPAATQVDLHGPAGSGTFGGVKALPNGNIVIIDASYNPGGQPNTGAVYLYNGRTRALISTLTGSRSGDSVGSAGVTVLTNGSYVLDSPYWNNGVVASAGAVTWCSGTLGCNGVVTTTNSLVGVHNNDQVGYGYGAVTALPNGNFVVDSPNWHNGAAAFAGADTWCSGTLGCAGVVTTTNSLVGGTSGDSSSSRGVTALTNGNYVVDRPNWSNGGAASSVGAATWCSGTLGCTGLITTTNSLVGSHAGDTVGIYGIKALTNGNYVVDSPYWKNGLMPWAGATTWCSGTLGCTGVLTAAGSLVGGQPNDKIGHGGVTALTNGNYVVDSDLWTQGAATNAGAATWCSGTLGCAGVVTTTNSLVGSHAGDNVGSTGIAALKNGNYVVDSGNWANGAVAKAGAATWCSGTLGCTGVVTTTNSLVGSQTNDQVSNGRAALLSDGNYVVDSGNWANGTAANAGAATWCSGTLGCTGVVTTTNSLVGSQTNDSVGGDGVSPLSNGNYVVGSPNWANSAAGQAGAATWCNSALGCTGPVSTINSLVGSHAGDQVGINAITALSNGNYVVRSAYWSNGALAQAGEVTWGDGATGITGEVTVTNSLVGSHAGDQLSSRGITALTNGDFVVVSSLWSNGPLTQSGAITWCSGTLGCTGVVSTTNSVLGGVAGDGSFLNSEFDYRHVQLVVGRPGENIVTFFDLARLVYLPLVQR